MLKGVTLRNMGPQSMPETIARCAALAEDADLDSLWITDHIAIPPDDAEGSGGRYLDPLITLAWIAASTNRIKLGTGVLILPYRSALPTAKQVATLQELAGERLLLGVGIGWMDAEFRALGLDRHTRGQTSDEVLELLNRCFAADGVENAAVDRDQKDVVEANGQAFLFKPKPAKPPIYVGGSAPHALKRAVRYGDGWLPMGLSPERLAADIETYQKLTEAAGKPPGLVTIMRGLPLDDAVQSRDLLAQYEEIGVERFVCGIPYATADEFSARIAQLNRIIE
ncbi:MAG: TIGR03619 family F420-dependent LLM class oxidoreductase [Gammaproteobacteria bacterium]|nr:MAG: TIGR03619 family F420-dependent LLM class oxidoreductase [Gammaproteobacteria bacterium]